MSGLYNVVLGTDPNIAGVLGALLARHDFTAGRLRDAWLEHGDDEGEVIARIFTRNGGPNRPDQEEAIESMRSHRGSSATPTRRVTGRTRRSTSASTSTSCTRSCSATRARRRTPTVWSPR